MILRCAGDNWTVSRNSRRWSFRHTMHPGIAVTPNPTPSQACRVNCAKVLLIMWCNEIYITIKLHWYSTKQLDSNRENSWQKLSISCSCVHLLKIIIIITLPICKKCSQLMIGCLVARKKAMNDIIRPVQQAKAAETSSVHILQLGHESHTISATMMQFVSALQCPNSVIKYL